MEYGKYTFKFKKVRGKEAKSIDEINKKQKQTTGLYNMV